MKKIAIFGLAAFAATFVGSANAQPPGGGRGGFGGMMVGPGGGGGNPTMMLMNKGVQDELKLSQEDVDAIVKKYNEETASLFAKVLAEKAKPEQVARFKQIRTQQMGFAAFQDAAIQKSLKMTEDQVKEVKEIAEDMRKEGDELRKSMQGGGGDFREMMTKMQAMQKDALTKASAVLKDDQKKLWEELTGKPFTMANPMGGGNRRRDQ